MDFQTLARKDLQFLCKKNRIPANTTNAAMANALQSLDVVEGIEEMQSKLGLQSVKSPEPPRSWRSSSSCQTTPVVEPKMQVSPLPRSRRVTAKALEIVDMSSDEKEERRDVPEQTLDSPAARRSTRKMIRRKAGPIASTPASNRSVPLPPAPQDDLDEKEGKRDVPEQTLDTPATNRSTRKMTRGRAGSIASTPASKRTVPLPPVLQDDLDEKEERRDVLEQTLETPAAIRSTRKMTRGRAGSIASTPASKPTVPLPPALQNDLDEKEEKRDMPEQTLDTPAARRSTRKTTRVRAGSIVSTPASKRTVSLPLAVQDEKEAKRDVPERTLGTQGTIRSTRKMTRRRAEAIASTPASKATGSDDLDEKEVTRDMPEQTLDTPAMIRSTRKMTRGRAEAIASSSVSKTTVPLLQASGDDLDEKEETRDVLEQTLDTPAMIGSTRKMTRGRAEAIASTSVSNTTVPLLQANGDDLDEKEETRDVPEQTPDTLDTIQYSRTMTRGGAEAIASTSVSKTTVPLLQANGDDLDEKEETRDVPEQTLDNLDTIQYSRTMTRGGAEAIASTSVSKTTVPLLQANGDDLDEKEETRDVPEQTLDNLDTIQYSRTMTRGGAEAIASTSVSKTTVPLLQANGDDLDEKEETRDVPEQTLDTLETIQSTRTMTKGRAEAIASTPASKHNVPLRPARQDDLDEKEELRCETEQTLDTPGTRKMTRGKADAVASTSVSKRSVPLRSACQDDSEAKYLEITYHRSSSLSLRKQAEEMNDVYSSRRKRAKDAVKMTNLAQEEATEEEKEAVENGDLVNVAHDEEKNYQEAEIQDSSSCLDKETTSKVVAVIGSPEEEERVVLEESPVMGLVSSDANTALVLKDFTSQTLANETPSGDFSSSKNKQTISASPSDGFCGVGEEEEEEKKLGELLTEMTLVDSEEGKVTQDASFISELPASELPKEETKFTEPSSGSQDVTFDTNGPNAPSDLCAAFNDPAREPADEVSVAVSKESETYQGAICNVLQADEEAGEPFGSAIIHLSNGTTTGGDVASEFSVSSDKTPDFSQDASLKPKITVISTEINDESSAVNDLRAITAGTTEVTEEISADDSSGEFCVEGVHEWDTGNKIPSISSIDEKLSGDSTTMSTTSISSIVQTESPGSEGDSAAVEREQWPTSDHLKSLSLRKLKALLKQKQKKDKMENKEPLIETAELQVSMENFREDKKAKMKKKSKESENKTRELEFCKDKFSEDKAKLERNSSPFMHLN